MTLRVCFLGNSHVAALRDAWRQGPDRWPIRWPGLEAGFVGAHKDLLLRTELRAGRLVPADAAAAAAFRDLSGIEDVDLAAWDAFVITGCLVSVATAANTYRDCRWVGLPSVAAHPDLASAPERLSSRAAARAAIEAAMASRLGPRLAAHLRAMTDRPILLTSQPRVSAAIKARRRTVTRAHHIALGNDDAAGLSAMFEAAAARVVAGAGALFVPQPAGTIEDHILTALPYMQGARRLTARGRAAQPEDDIMHANAAYGALVLDQVVAVLTA